MSKAKLPTKIEIERLLAFLPKLSSPDFNPIKKWGGGNKSSDGVIQMRFPIYDPTVDEFMTEAYKECWQDPAYPQKDVLKMLKNPSFINKSTLFQIKSMLTYIVRGERFCDGHWAAMINNGHVEAVLERLGKLTENAK
jgi:uncharacterized protein DUF6508